ncbi:hypothetical protein EPUS_03656 [Endocarpon pusillum Z07020]|uniref:Uncharacterized protein n=1 Tax=Endocarpon pusillum (strain Z07020 / HMAS-L-300199) TaxID=1263415 RepID=U1HL28_ENDPU|nr:uncharacterized protein EPUS_03656 [Endocarpon pusillum Z07020]ERF69664.1 hypothetical protein EPUS_03656 [Endocarpon pusillum Z07020]
MPPAAERREAGAVTDDQSGSANSSANSSDLTSVVPLAVGCTILLVLSFCIFIFAYRWSRLRRGMIERRTQQEKGWMRAEPTGPGQDFDQRERIWKTPAQTGPAGGTTERDSFLTVLSDAPTGDEGLSETRALSASPSPPPPAYTTIAMTT